MAEYPAPRVYEEVFNVENFSNFNSFQNLFNVAKTNVSNTFQSIQTFLDHVLIAASLTVSDLNVINSFLGYPVSYFTGLVAPIQQQFDGISSGATINSTVSVGPTITLSPEMNANVQNLGTYTNAVLQFEIPMGKHGIMGPTGISGTIGPTGQTGPMGYGATGPTGNAGTNGIDGTIGATGPTGAAGLSIYGPTGATGPIGTTGLMGPTGYTGCTGPMGERGEQGPQGDRGEKGDKGDTGPQGKKGDSGADGNSTATNIAAFFALSAVIAAVGAAILAFMAGSDFASKMTDLGYATYVYVDSKCGLFTAVGLEYIGYQQCNGSLKINNGVQNTVILSNNPSGKSEFGYDVQFDNNIISKGSIVNADNRSLSVISSADLNLSSTGEDINLSAGRQVVFNTPQTIMSNDFLTNSIKPVATNDSLTISHTNVICQNTLTTNTLSGTITGQTESNLTITHPNVIIGNNLKTDTIGPILTTDDLTLSHNKIKIPNSLHTDNVHPIDTTTTTPSELVLHHDKVTIPSDLMVSSIKPLEGGLNNNISIFGDSIIIGTNTSNVYVYGRLHIMNPTNDDGFFEEVNGFLNQTGI